MKTLGRSGLLILLALLASCSARREEPGSFEQPTEAYLRVVNNNWDNMRISVRRSGRSIRLGTAPGLRSTNFTLSRNVVGNGTPLQIQAEGFASGETFETQIIDILPGHRMELVLQNNLTFSTLVLTQ